MSMKNPFERPFYTLSKKDMKEYRSLKDCWPNAVKGEEILKAYEKHPNIKIVNPEIIFKKRMYFIARTIDDKLKVFKAYGRKNNPNK